LEIAPWPLVRIDLPKGKAPEFRGAISQGIQAALVETCEVPEQDLFQIFMDHDAGSLLVHAPRCLGIEYTDELTIIQLTVSDTRSLAQKRRLFARIIERLASAPGCDRPTSSLISSKLSRRTSAEDWRNTHPTPWQVDDVRGAPDLI
jgi:4-oxalocrotonate tautomerase